jgi:hypothetical protein
MPNDAKTSGAVGSDAPAPTGLPPTPALEPRLPVLRFGLRQLFWFLTVVCLVLAGVVAAPTPGVARLAVLLAVLVVLLHLAATALGSRLREHADEQIAWRAAHNGAAEKDRTVPARPATARSPWHERGQPMRWRWGLIGVGAAAGGILGTVVFLRVDALAPSLPGVVFGALSTAVVGGWIAFLGSNFWVMLRRGWRDAVAKDRQD